MIINATKQWDYIIEKMKKSADIDEAKVHSESKVIAQQIASDARITVEQLKPKKEMASKSK
jgi:hypothetical protein